MALDPKIPGGPLAEKWDRHRFESKLVNPANRRKYTVIVVGTGLAGGAAAATLSELGYNVLSFCYQDSPRRAASRAAPGRAERARPRAARPGRPRARIRTRVHRPQLLLPGLPAAGAQHRRPGRDQRCQEL